MKSNSEFLLDTNVLSELRRGTAAPTRWIAANQETSCFVSVIALSEIEKGIIKLKPIDLPVAQMLGRWLAGLRQQYAGRIVPIDEDVALASGRIQAGRTRGIHDCQIAATAQVHGLTLVTRNTADFADLAIPLVNPWEPAL